MRGYLEIEKARFGDRLQYSIEVSDDARDSQFRLYPFRPLWRTASSTRLRPSGKAASISCGCCSVWTTGPRSRSATTEAGRGSARTIAARPRARFAAVAAGNTLYEGSPACVRTAPGSSSDPMLRAYLIDDEELALKRLAACLTATGRVEIAGYVDRPCRGAELIQGRCVISRHRDAGHERVRVPSGARTRSRWSSLRLRTTSTRCRHSK